MPRRASHRRRSRAAPPLVAALGLCLAVSTGAAIESLRLSPDTTALLGGTTTRDDQVGEDDLAGTVTLVGPGLPEAADLTGYHRLADGDVLFSLDVGATLAGPLTVEPRDVVRWDSGVFSLELDGSTQGVPAGVRVDAVSRNGADLLISFDVTVTLDGVTFEDEDLTSFDGATFSMFLDGSTEGVPPELDLDGAHLVEADGTLLLSFDTGGELGGVAFADEDVLLLDRSGGLALAGGGVLPRGGAGPTWALAYDGSAHHPGWLGADLDAVAPGLIVPPATATATPTATATASPSPTVTPTPTDDSEGTATPTHTSTVTAAATTTGTPTASSTPVAAPAPALYEIPTLSTASATLLVLLLLAIAISFLHRQRG